MKTRIDPFHTAMLMIFLALAMLAGRVTAQTFTVLHTFTAHPAPYYTNSDGAGPSELLLSGDTLYGGTAQGGPSGNGTVFKLNTDGTGFKNLYSFSAFSRVERVPPLILSANTLYGVTDGGGSSGSGTVFALGTNGTSFSTLYNFTALDRSSYPWINTDGGHPTTGLILSGNTLYGTTMDGGTSGRGAVFALNTDGTEFSALYNFTASDGFYPNALIVSGNTLYGTAFHGGNYGSGTVFALNTDGTGFRTLYNFTATTPITTPSSFSSEANSDGASPNARLILSGNTLYGTTWWGGTCGRGTVFALHTDGSGFTNLHTFTEGSNGTDSEGAGASAGLILSGNTLYGTTSSGGSAGVGTVFAVNIDGTGSQTVHSFSARPYPYTNSDGAEPEAGLILSGNTLYGTAFNGGSSASGTIFSISFTPQLSITPSGPNVILSWPTNYAGFDYTGYTLQSTMNLASPTVWSPVSAAPVVVSGQNTVTNPISGTQQFFRLSQ